MLNKILLTAMTLPIVINNPLSVNYNDIQHQMINSQYDELSSSILKDISDYSQKEKMILDSKIVFKQHTLKELFVIGNIRANQKQWDRYTTHTFAYPIEFDPDTRTAYGQIYNSFEQVYKDPEPGWCDPAGARWGDRQKTIYASSQKIYGAVQESPDWFGNTVEMHFKAPEQADIDDGYMLSYSPHSYFTHQIRMYSNGSYTKEAINQTFKMNEITNTRFVQTFVTKNTIPLTNQNMVWNKESIRTLANVYGFDENLMIIKTLVIAKQTIENLKQLIIRNTENGVWKNSDFSLQEVQSLINKIQNYQFNDFKQFKQLNNKIAQNLIMDIDGNYEPLVQQLNNSLYSNHLVPVIDYINLNNVESMYKIIVLFFKNNKIFFNFNINKQNKQVCVWDGQDFPNLLEQLKYENFNYLNVQLDSINVIYIGDISQTSCFNQDYIIEVKNDISLLNRYNFEILYRYNALNIDSTIEQINTKMGVLINSNKFVSELVSTDYQNSNELILKYKPLLLQNINDILDLKNPKNIKSDLIDISSNSKQYLLNKFSLNELKTKSELLNLDFNEWFNFIPNNYDGIFYAILKIDNWKFIDKTDGDFTKNFKERFFSSLNKSNINVVELRSTNQITTFDNSGYFLCRFRTNRVIFDYYENKPIIDIENIESVKQQIRHFFSNNENHWSVINKIDKWSDFFYNYEQDNYRIDVINSKLNVDLEIDSSKFKSPSNMWQFKTDLLSNPIIHFLDKNAKYVLMHEEAYSYLTSQGSTTLNIKVNLLDFLNLFYNSDLDKIQSNITKHFDNYQNDLNDSVKIRKTLNWLPSVILISSFTILIILLSIIVTFTKKKYKGINII